MRSEYYSTLIKSSPRCSAATHAERIKPLVQKSACQTLMPIWRMGFDSPRWRRRIRAVAGSVPEENFRPEKFCRHCHRAPKHLLTCAFVRELARVENWLDGSGCFTIL